MGLFNIRVMGLYDTPKLLQADSHAQVLKLDTLRCPRVRGSESPGKFEGNHMENHRRNGISGYPLYFKWRLIAGNIFFKKLSDGFSSTPCFIKFHTSTRQNWCGCGSFFWGSFQPYECSRSLLVDFKVSYFVKKWITRPGKLT